MKDSWYSWLLTAQAFLVAVALCLQSLRQRFSWMRVTEPVLDRLSSGPGCSSWPWLKLPLLSSILCPGNDLQNRLFFVQNKGPVMELLAASKESTRPSILNRYCLEEWSQVIKASFLFF